MPNFHKVIKGTVGGWPQTLNEGDLFDADDPKFAHFDVSRLVGLGVVKAVQPEPEEAMQLAELGDKELSALAGRLGVVDVAKKGRKELAREVLAAQAKDPHPSPISADGATEQE